jgi:hypothetical protein
LNQRQLGALAGILSPVIFVNTFTLEGWLRPGYNPFGMYVSELALGPRGWIQAVNFVVSGLLFIVFAWGVAAEFKTGKASRVGPILLAIIGISLFVSGFFTMDPVGTLPSDMTIHGFLHNIFGAIVFSLAPVSCFVFLRRFRQDPKWQHLQWWTLVVAIIITIAIIIMKVGPTQPPAGPNAFNEWIGLTQRTVLIPYFGWILTVALTLYRQIKQR